MHDGGQVAGPQSLFASDGRTVTVAMDHALGSGQVAPLDRPRPLLDQVLRGEPDGLILSEGMRRLLPASSTVPWLLTADYFASSVMPGGAGDEELQRFLWTAEDAKERGASGLKCLLVFGQRNAQSQAENVASVARLVSAAERVGLPVMVEATLWGQRVPADEQNAARSVENAARIAFELGADIIKIAIPDDVRALERLAEALPVPIVLMGGPHVDAADLFGRLRDAIDAGARGLALGRNVWGSEDPHGFVRALKLLVHDGASPEDALESLRLRRLDTH